MPGQVETYVGNVRLLVDYAKPGILLSEISKPMEDKSATTAPVLLCDAEIARLTKYLRDQECRFGRDSKLHCYSGIVALGGYACIDMNGQLSIFKYEIKDPELAKSQFLATIWRIHTNQGLATHFDALCQWLDGHVREYLLGSTRTQRMQMRRPDDQFFERAMREARKTSTVQRQNNS